jgi:uncharacterized protein (DUF1501 family)
MDLSRRHFLRMAGGGLGSAALLKAMDQFGLATALAGQTRTPYQALVCIFLAGGNDGNNTVIPYDGYAAYAAVRSGPGLAIPQANILPIATSFGTFGLHPSMEIQGLFGSGTIAILCGVGPLVAPMTKQQYQNGTVTKPLQLFSHADQVNQWQTSKSDGGSSNGWGGRIADRVPPSSTGFPIVTSVTGSNGGIFTVGAGTRPLAIQPAPTALNQVLALKGFGTSAVENARRQSFDDLRTFDTSSNLIAAASNVTSQALSLSDLLSVDPVLNTVFPNSQLGYQLKQVAKVIKANQDLNLGLTRQVFFCLYGGFDTHQGELNTQMTHLQVVSQAMKAFYDATVELGVSGSVTTFTMSDFSRTFQPSGSGANVGTDHAWANHHFIMGDSVNGGDFYGVPGSNGTPYPTLVLGANGPDDTDTRGRWIPTSSVDQYGATLAKWFGLDDTQVGQVFPNLGSFPAGPDLGFMGTAT